MRIDLFEFFESTFRGLVYFFYNVVETLWVLARRPWRGPTLLYRCYTQRGRQQIGGLTYLFLILFVLVGLFAQFESVTSDEVNWYEFASRMPRLDSDQVWITVISAVVSTVLIDCAARLYFLWRIPNGKDAASRGRQLRRRKRRVAEFEYALVWPALLVPLGGVTLLILALRWIFMRDESIPMPFELAIPLWVLISILAAAPAVTRLKLRPWARVTGGSWLRRIGRFAGRVVAQAGVAALLLLAVALGCKVMSDLADAQPKPETEPMENSLQIASLRCIVDGAGTLHVDVALQNPADKAVVYNLRNAPTVHIARGESGIDVIRLAPADSLAAPLLLPPRQAQMARLVATGPKVAALRNEDRCTFDDEGYSIWMGNSPTATIEFTRDVPRP
jgi:hypothetical protein